MHDDRVLVEGRLRRELHQRLMPAMYAASQPLHVDAWDVPGEPVPWAVARKAFDEGRARAFTVGDSWSRPWGTTWFQFDGVIAHSWADALRDGRVEAVIDLGFHQDAAGFQSEGLVYDAGGNPVQGIHPRRMAVRVDDLVDDDGSLRMLVEAASNPAIPQFAPTRLGRLSTAGDRPLYRLKQASLCVRDDEVFHLLLDAEVLFDLSLALATDDPRRRRLLRQLEDAFDRIDMRSPTTISATASAARTSLAEPLAQRAHDGAHRIIAVGHAHIDSAWLWPIRETKRKCARTFASALRLMDDYPEYVFVCSQAAQYEWIEQQHPVLAQRITAAVQRGQWQPVGGMWVEPDMNLASGESIVRQLVHGQRWFTSRYGVRCSDVWIPDVFGYPASLPQIFAAGGCERFVTQKLSWNKTNRFPHSTFRWQGIDGTRVLTHFPPVDTYNATVSSAEVVFAQANFKDGGWSDWSLMPYGHGNGGGGPTREMVERARRFHGVGGGVDRIGLDGIGLDRIGLDGIGLDGAPVVSLGTTDAFFEQIEREAAASTRVPVWTGELYFETHRGTLTSQSVTKVGNRRCERLLREAELWWAAVACRQPAAVPAHIAGVLDRLWKDTLLQQFHDILPGSSIGWVHDDAAAEHQRIAASLESLIAEALQHLVASPVAVANAAAVDRREVVDVGGLPVVVDVPAAAVVAVATASATEAAGDGGTDQVPLTDPVVVTEHSMSNGIVALRWNLDGDIVSLIDIRAGREVLPTGGRVALTLAADRPVEYDAWDLEHWTVTAGLPLDGDATVQLVESGPLRARLQVTRRWSASDAVITVTMCAGSPRVDIEIDVHWGEREHYLAMEVPVDVHTDHARCGIQFGHVLRPTHASTSWDAAKFEVCAHEWVDLAEPSFGLAVLTDGRYGHGVHAAPGGGQRVRVSLLRGACYPDPDADDSAVVGRHRMTVSLLPHGAGLYDVLDHAERLSIPLRIVSDETKSQDPPDPMGAGASAGSLVRVSHPGVRTAAVKMADDGSGDLVVRLFEACGDRSTLTLHADRRIIAAARCNLLEEPYPDGALDVADGIIAVTLRPFELVTLRLRR